MELYAGIDLHSNNSVVEVLDAQDRVIFAKRLPNDLAAILAALHACPGKIVGVAVESTYNWYWLVDGLEDAGFKAHLVNTTAVKQYDGLKHSGDFADAQHLAHLLRLGILPTGYICPRHERALRDLMRKRSQLVQLRSSQILSIQNLVARNLGDQISGNEIKRWATDHIAAMPQMLPEHRLALEANFAMMTMADYRISLLEREILARAGERQDYLALRTVSGIGQTLALTIALETGDIGRFASPGDFASYARLVDSRRESNGKKKGQGNTRCGNRFLAWAFIEAAHFAVRYNATVRSWYQKKCAHSKAVVAIKAVAHKLARACFYIMKDGQPFDAARAFG